MRRAAGTSSICERYASRTHPHSQPRSSLPQKRVGMLSCHGCDGGRCGYSVSYTEGSSIRGHLVYDSFSFGSADGGERRVRASFGCQTYESGLFQSQACCLPSLELLHLAGAFSFTSLAASRSSASSHHRRVSAAASSARARRRRRPQQDHPISPSSREAKLVLCGSVSKNNSGTLALCVEGPK